MVSDNWQWHISESILVKCQKSLDSNTLPESMHSPLLLEIEQLVNDTVLTNDEGTATDN